MLERDTTQQAAIQLHGMKYNVMPLNWRSKKPRLRTWKVRQEKRLTRVELRSLFHGRSNLAVICGELEETGVNVVALDFDCPEEFAAWEGPAANTVVKTAKGYHAWFQLALGIRLRNSIDCNGRAMDVRHHGAYVVAPPSIHESGVGYEFVKGPVPADHLVMLPTDILVEPCTEPKSDRLDQPPEPKMRKAIKRPIRNPEAWCMKVPSVMGQNGSAALVRVVACLRDCGRTVEETLRFVRDVWNPVNAAPPWAEHEIIHCIARLFARTKEN